MFAAHKAPPTGVIVLLPNYNIDIGVIIRDSMTISFNALQNTIKETWKSHSGQRQG